MHKFCLKSELIGNCLKYIVEKQYRRCNHDLNYLFPPIRYQIRINNNNNNNNNNKKTQGVRIFLRLSDVLPFYQLQFAPHVFGLTETASYTNKLG